MCFNLQQAQESHLEIFFFVQFAIISVWEQGHTNAKYFLCRTEVSLKT